MAQTKTSSKMFSWILGASAALTALFVLTDPVPQSQAYHQFADQRSLLGIANAFDVLSNLAFLYAGLLGLWYLRRGPQAGAALHGVEIIAWRVFFGGVALTALGSSWYHLAPDNTRLVWDRLPMTIGFMSLFAIIIGERISFSLARKLLWPASLLGLATVLYWYFTEQAGVGDLRPYILVQIGPLLAIPILMALRPAKYTRGGDLMVAIGFYVAAKITEGLDTQIYGFGQLVSGHTIKHVLAGIGCLWLARMLRLRVPIAPTV